MLYVDQDIIYIVEVKNILVCLVFAPRDYFLNLNYSICSTLRFFFTDKEVYKVSKAKESRPNNENNFYFSIFTDL